MANRAESRKRRIGRVAVGFDSIALALRCLMKPAVCSLTSALPPLRPISGFLKWQHLGMPPQDLTPFLGASGGRGIALLYNGILGDKSLSGGNVLNLQTLRVIRAAAGDYTGALIVYGERTLLSPATLEAEGLTFKQTPYDVRARK